MPLRGVATEADDR
eukprot:ctg_4708.g428